MDKLFIQNAFKTLDEIEEEMKNSAGKEKLTEELIENTTTPDLDELQDKYVGVGCVIKDPQSQYVDNCGSIQTLVDFNGDFDKSVWKVVLDSGISLNVSGSQLSAALEEKLPKDLARAYATSGETSTQNTPLHLKRAYYPNHLFPKEMPRKGVTIDFENSNYREISADEAIEQYSSKKDRYKLRLIYIPKVGRSFVVMWDKNGDLMNLKKEMLPFVHSVTNFKEIVQAASRIYVTDEDEHQRQLTQPEQDPAMADLIDLAGQIPYDPPYNTSGPEMIKGYGAARRVADIVAKTTNRGIPDTGKHPARWQIRFSAKTLLRRAEDAYKKALQQNRLGAQNTDVVMRALKSLKSAQEDYWRSKDQLEDSRSTFTQHVSESVAKFVLLKFLAEQAAVDYERVDQKGVNHPWREAKKQLDDLQQQLKDLLDQIQKVRQVVDEPKLKQEYEDKIAEVLDKSADAYDHYVGELNDLRKEHGLKTTESLNVTEISPRTSHLRIYTVDDSGEETFVDDPTASEETMLAKAKELAKEYKKVCLVRVASEGEPYEEPSENLVTILYDSDEGLTEAVEEKQTFGELIDSILNKQSTKETLSKEAPQEHSLTEGKSFNIKDENEVVDALAYKGVGEETEDELVVIDPAVASLDDEYEAHVGDAILQCFACKSSFFLPAEKIEAPEEGEELYNKDMACPHCGAKDGFYYKYQVGKKETAEDESNEVPAEGEEAAKEKEEPALEPVENDFVEIDDVDNVQEESFERLINPYLTKLYENVSSFKTTKIYQPSRNNLKIEGKLIGKNGNEKLVEFLFINKENKNKTLVLEGFSPLLTDNQKAYTLMAEISNKELVFENFTYNYSKVVDGESILIEGVEK